MKILHFYNLALKQSPLLTKSVSAFFLFSIGDYLCQKFENKFILQNNKKSSIDYKRIIKQGSFGFIVAPYLHLQYCIIIPRLFPESSKFFLFKSTAYAVTVSDGVFNFAFFLYMGMISQRSDDFSKDIYDKFLPVQMTNMQVYPVITGFNFYMMSPAYRVLFDNFTSIFWNIYLSFVENNKNENNYK